MITAPVNKIIPFSSVDGYGNRTAIFLQGCNQNCLYCHNPETIHLCRGCGACVKACPAGALSMNGGKVVYDYEKCCQCDTCLKTCQNGASPKIRNLNAEQIMNEIRAYFPFINGITTSGGECSLHLDFLRELYTEVKAAGKTTYMDTNGQTPLWNREDVLEVTDMTMIDLKAGTEEDHRRVTGMGLATPMENIRQMAAMEKLYEIRTVVVPGIADNEATVRLGSSLIAAYPKVRYKLIKYRPYGVREQYLSDITAPTDEMMEHLKAVAESCGAANVLIT